MPSGLKKYKEITTVLDLQCKIKAIRLIESFKLEVCGNSILIPILFPLTAKTHALLMMFEAINKQ